MLAELSLNASHILDLVFGVQKLVLLEVITLESVLSAFTLRPIC
jgi:hypothetical protein